MNHGKNLLESHKYNGINATLDIIQMVIDEAIDTNADDYQKFLVSWLQAAIVFGIAWGIGGILSDESRKQFDQFHKKVNKMKISVRFCKRHNCYYFFCVCNRFGPTMMQFLQV